MIHGKSNEPCSRHQGSMSRRKSGPLNVLQERICSWSSSVVKWIMKFGGDKATLKMAPCCFSRSVISITIPFVLSKQGRSPWFTVH